MKTSVKLIKALAKNVKGSDTAPCLGLLITEWQERLGYHLLALCSMVLKPKNAFAAGRRGQLPEEAEKAKQIAC